MRFSNKEEAVELITLYAEASHEYYNNYNSIMSDSEYDELCKTLLKRYQEYKPHDDSNYLDIDMLKCGSGYHINLDKDNRK